MSTKTSPAAKAAIAAAGAAAASAPAPAEAPAAPAAQAIPEGYRQDAKGRLVPESVIKPIDLTRDELVNELVGKAKALSKTITAFRAEVFDLADQFVALSAAEFKVALGGKKGNLTLHSFDGRYKVLLAIAEHMTFDERLQAAKALIDECINEWAEDSRPEIKVLVSEAFDTDKEGKLNTGKILGLRRYDIKDARWQKAMQAIGESLQVVGSKRYVRFYERVGDTDKYDPITLDIAGA